MSTLDDTSELRRIAEENYQARTRPADIGGITVTAALALAVAMWAYPALDTDRFSIDGSRWAMAAASVLSAVVATFCGVYVLDRRNRKRTERVVATLETMQSVLCRIAKQLGVERELEQIPAEHLHEMTREAFRLGRRSRTADE